MEPAAGLPDGHGLEQPIRASAGFGPCRCGESLLIIDVSAGTVRCSAAKAEDGDGVLLQTFASAVAAATSQPSAQV